MKKLLTGLLLALFIAPIYSQSPEAVQIQINDLEEAKIYLQTQKQDINIQIKDIDLQLSELNKKMHELKMNLADKGFPGYNTAKVNLISSASTIEKPEILASIPAHTLLLVTGYEKGKYKTAFNGMAGYIPKYLFKFNDPEHEEILVGKRVDDREKRKENTLIRLYGEKQAKRILNKQIWIGMTKGMLLDSWGYPDDINRTVSTGRVHEQCIYGDKYVYVENGKVTSWQD